MAGGILTTADLFGESSSFTDMTASEKELFASLIKEEMARRGKGREAKQIRDIVPIKEWLSTEYFLGSDVNNVYPYWKDFLCDLFDEKRETNNKRINNVILSGSIGTGKSTISEIIMLRKLYELSCYENINALFHLMQSASIMFLYFSINKATAEATGFGSLRAWVDNSPYFNQYFPRRKRLDSVLVFPENVTIAYGSRSSDSIGRNLICSIMDEANFVGSSGDNKSGNVEKATEMFSGIVNRSNSRFIIEGGQNYSLNILVSSSTTESSATERQISASTGDAHTLIAAPSQWEVKPEKFSKEYFFVMKGTNYLEPKIVESVDDVNNFRVSEGLPKEQFRDGLTDLEEIEKSINELPPHHQAKFLKVPVDLRHGFEINMIRSLQDLAGISIGAQGKLFSSVAVFNNAIDERLHHPFIAQEIEISTGDRIEIKDYLRSDFRLKNPERPRFIHIDQSFRTDSTGIACCYVSDVMIDEETGLKKPIVSYDFMLRINPPKPPRKIAIYKIRNFIVWLGTSFGMNIGKITYDIFNSEESRQILEEMGFNVGYQSVDRTDKAYLDFVELMYEGRIKIYDYQILRHELFNLIHFRDKRKVDHPKTTDGSDGNTIGSKDTSDAVVGALESLLSMTITDDMGSGSNIEDFLYANTLNGLISPDALTAEQMIDSQLDEMIEEMEIYGLDAFGDGIW